MRLKCGKFALKDADRWSHSHDFVHKATACSKQESSAIMGNAVNLFIPTSSEVRLKEENRILRMKVEDPCLVQ